MTTFADTSALYAVLDRDDDWHPAARKTWTRLLERDEALLTSNYVIVECFALIQNRLGMDALRIFTGDVLPALRIQWLSEDDHRAAVQMALAANRRDLSLVDCSSFHLMRRLDVASAFAFDAHFEEQGFSVLRE